MRWRSNQRKRNQPSSPILHENGAASYGGEGEHFPAFRACSGSGGGGAGRLWRSSTSPRALCLAGLARRVIAQALVLALLVVKAEPGGKAGLGLGDGCVGIEV